MLCPLYVSVVNIWALHFQANEIVEGQTTVLRNKSGFLDVEAGLPRKCGPIAAWQESMMTLPGMPHLLVKLLNRLLVIQEISAIVLACQLNEVDKETLFFSRLGSALTVSDYILRKLRGLIVVVSIDYISRELLGDDKLKSLPIKAEEKRLNMACQERKKKSRNSKQIHSTPNSSGVNSILPPTTVVLASYHYLH